MGNAPDVSLKRRVHILNEAQLRTYTLTGTIPNCKEHGHASREEAENKLRWRKVSRIDDRVLCLRSYPKPDRTWQNAEGWEVFNQPDTRPSRLPVGWQLLTPQTAE